MRVFSLESDRASARKSNHSGRHITWNVRVLRTRLFAWVLNRRRDPPTVRKCSENPLQVCWELLRDVRRVRFKPSGQGFASTKQDGNKIASQVHLFCTLLFRPRRCSVCVSSLFIYCVLVEVVLSCRFWSPYPTAVTLFR